MKFPIHLRCADRDSRWPFRSLSTILHTRTKSDYSEPTEHNLIHGQHVLPEEDWLTISYRDEHASDLNLALSHSLRSTPCTLPLHRGRPSSTQESYSTPTARNDTRRYAVYLPDYDFSTLLANRPIKIDPTMLTPTTAPCPPPARDRQVRSRRPRQVTYRPENVHDPDQPPQYSATDPHPLRRSRRVRMNIVQGMQDVGRIAKDLPTSVKGAQKRVNEKRARGKMQWLERHNFLSAQDRLLREELRH